MITISVIIPIFNEEKTILNILNKLQDLKEHQIEIIVVNDGSTDNSKEILDNNKDLFFKLISFEKNKGKGRAIIEGLKHATSEYLFFQDADLEYDPEDIFEFIKLVEKYDLDLVMGSRFISSNRSVLHFWHMLGNRFISFLFNIINDTTFSDIYCCYLFFRRKNINENILKSQGWGQQAEILTQLVKNSKKIHELGVSYNARNYEEGKKIKFINIFEVIYWIVFTKIKLFFVK